MTTATRELLLVTGHTRGLGAALVAHATAQGATVVGIGRRRAASTTAAHEVVADLADPTAAADAVHRALACVDLADFTGVHLVANAGLLQPVRVVGSLGAAAVAEAVSVNVTAPVVMTDALLAATDPTRVERRVALVSSGAGRHAYAGWAVYGATKAALDHFARAVALEAPPATRVSSVAPGVIDTDMQAEIRAASLADFPTRPRFDALARDGALPPAHDVAVRFLAHLRGDSFGAEPVVDLRDL